MTARIIDLATATLKKAVSLILTAFFYIPACLYIYSRITREHFFTKFHFGALFISTFHSGACFINGPPTDWTFILYILLRIHPKTRRPASSVFSPDF